MLSKTDRETLLLSVSEQFLLAYDMKGESPEGSVILAKGPAFFKAYAPHQYGAPSQMIAFDLYERLPFSRPMVAFAYATILPESDIWVPPFIETHMPDARVETLTNSAAIKNATIRLWMATCDIN